MFIPFVFALTTCIASPASTAASWAQEPEARTPVVFPSEDQIGLTLFRPQNIDARMLIKYAGELTDRQVAFTAPSVKTGMPEVRFRDRFLQIEQAVGVQGDSKGRAEAVALLAELDARIGAMRNEASPEPKTVTRTLRLRSLRMDVVSNLLGVMAPTLERQFVPETGTVILRGASAEVARAEALLLEVDQPTPQMTLHIKLIEAVDAGVNVSTLGAAVGGDLAASLAQLLPGKAFRDAGQFMLRASVSGVAPIEISSGIGDSAQQPQRRFKFRAASRGWDAERGVLSFGACEFVHERPTFKTAVTSVTQSGGRTEESTFSGYTSEGLTTELALRRDEQTVLGSVGDNALFIVLRFTVD
ncbi:MAG: hypothetical protein R3F49_11235 [Planctomycetota bacterium]